MGIVIKGGSTVINGKGRTNMGPTIPMEGLVMVIDPTIAEATSSAYRVYTPLTSSILTATTANIAPAANVGLRTYAYPTGAAGFVYVNTGSNGTFTSQGTARQTYIDIQGDLLTYLRNNVQNQATILFWYAGVAPALAYPEVFSDTFGNYKFGFRTNVSPSPTFSPQNQYSPSNASSEMGLGAATYGASTARTWNSALLQSPAFSTTASMLAATTTHIPTSVYWGYAVPVANQTKSIDPSYTAHEAVPNPPTFHRLIPTSLFRGREVYRDLDGWNCFAMSLNQTDKAITSSVYINGGSFLTQTAPTASRTAGQRSRGSTSSFAYTISNTNGDSFYFSGSALPGIRISIIPTSSGIFTDTAGYPANNRSYYCASGSTADQTLQNVVNKINNTTELAAFFSASFVTPSGIAISGSFEGTQFNRSNNIDSITFNYSSSTIPVNIQLFTLTGGTAPAGSGPITTTLLQQVPNANALRIGAYETSFASGFARGGLVGLLGAVYVYNRVLSQQEITQVYNALKSRYGNTAPGNTPKRTYRIFNSLVSSSAGQFEDPPFGSGIGY